MRVQFPHPGYEIESGCSGHTGSAFVFQAVGVAADVQCDRVMQNAIQDAVAITRSPNTSSHAQTLIAGLPQRSGAHRIAFSFTRLISLRIHLVLAFLLLDTTIQAKSGS